MPLSNKDRIALIGKWHAAKKAREQAEYAELELRREVCKHVFGEYPTDGTHNFDLPGGYKLKGVFKHHYNLENSEKLDGVLDRFPTDIRERIVTFSPRLSLTEYKRLEEGSSYRQLIDSVLTITPASPSLTIVEPKGK